MMFNFHKRCDREIYRLERLLDYETRKNEALQEQVALLQSKPHVPVATDRGANVFYMDDARLLEMQENGDAPT
jgi:hypothetical protein